MPYIGVSILRQSLILAFGAHDVAADFLAAHLRLVKRLILVVAHLSLLGIFFPSLGRDYGNLALTFLLVVLLLSPLSRIFGMRLFILAMGLRRELGILMGYLAVVHGAGYLIADPTLTGLILQAPDASLPRMTMLGLQFGFLALLLTLPPLFTSNNFSVRFLGSGIWKRVHWLVYLLLLAALLHQSFVRAHLTEVFLYLKVSVMMVGYAALKYFAWSGRLPLFGGWREAVALRYREYRSAIATRP